MKIACPKCGADVSFDPSSGKCYCDHCSSYIDVSEFELKQYEKEKQHAQAMNDEQIEENARIKDNINQDPNDLYDGFRCESCGAQLITDKTTTITRCVYCGSQQMIKQRLVGKFEPLALIPFKIDKESFIYQYKNFVNSMRLAPEEFRNNPNINETKGLYVPFHLFEYNIKTYGRGVGEYKDDDHTFREWFEKSESEDVFVPVDGSVRLDDNIMSSLEPYYIEEMVDFNPAYITGFQSECTDETEESLNEKAEDRVFVHSIKRMKSLTGRYTQVGGLLTSDMHMINTPKYVLLPIWFVNCIYKDKKYSYALNGQTGKVVGEIPLSKPKFRSLMTLLVAIAITLTLLVLAGASYSSRDYYDDDDGDGVGTIIFIIWAGGVAAPYAHIKKKYKNVSHIFERPIPYKNRNNLISKTFNRKEYKEKFSNDDLSKMTYQKYINGEYVKDFDYNRMITRVKLFNNESVSINNKNL